MFMHQMGDDVWLSWFVDLPLNFFLLDFLEGCRNDLPVYHDLKTGYSECGGNLEWVGELTYDRSGYFYSSEVPFILRVCSDLAWRR